MSNSTQTKEELLQKITELEEKKKPLEKQLRKLREQEENGVEEKVARCKRLEDKFSPEDLVFAAFSRCRCGAGLAYPKNIGMHGAWHCSDILLGRALPKTDPNCKEHDGDFPFAFYEIKSEGQPSAHGSTTRS